ncbi:hypothetical protein NUU61_004949 [Penicillium alfredii]|uniref:Uncharacterized protein n=1 Tax=Penicillium alfredii TaxID=1506179 RepID=A0A9W9K740_9EURO|nr:uncharacterized protein NUU61_004949 [Penicillium alfredii]KAJ5095593.1 hypothetical protein NUU61_004949 [Penicillium alfredii]
MNPSRPPYFSPKRKRESSESDCYSSSASPTSTVSIVSFQEARLREDEVGRHSPRAAVAGRFGELAIRGELLSDSGLSTSDFQRQRVALPSQKRCVADPCRDSEIMAEGAPTLSTESNNESHALSSEPPAKGPNDHTTALNTSPSKRKAAPPSRKQQTLTSPSKIRKTRPSPPLTDTPSEDPLTWHDSEITGHNPTDPTDDGYGINGVGFKPTATIAWARSQKRQKQVAEWKTREAREAREKRREKRGKVSAWTIRAALTRARFKNESNLTYKPDTYTLRFPEQQSYSVFFL